MFYVTLLNQRAFEERIGKGPIHLKENYTIGKLPYHFLQELLARQEITDDSVIIGPRPGEDCGVIRTGSKLLVVKTDPITFTSNRPAWYLIHVNANDIASMGAVPRWMAVTMLLPPGIEKQRIEEIFDELYQTCKSINITVVGGHTEITEGLDRPILIGAVFGEVEEGKLIDKKQTEAGDLILLTKGVAIEGTTIIAAEKSEELKREFGEQTVKEGLQLLEKPGISVVKEAILAAETGQVHAMHDVTEGGLLGGIYELLDGIQMGGDFFADKIHIFDSTDKFCDFYRLDPLKLIASGALLIAVPMHEAVNMQKRLSNNGIHAAIIGRVMPRSSGIRIKRNGVWETIKPPESDEVTKLFEKTA